MRHSGEAKIQTEFCFHALFLQAIPFLSGVNWNYRSCNCRSCEWQSDLMRHKDMAKTFAAVLRKHRKEKGFTQEILAEKSDIASKMVSLIERCERNPSLNVADSIAQGLDVSLSEMIKEAELLRRKSKSKE